MYRRIGILYIENTVNVDEYDRLYLAELHQQLSEMIIVCNGALDVYTRTLLTQFTDYIIVDQFISKSEAWKFAAKEYVNSSEQGQMLVFIALDSYFINVNITALCEMMKQQNIDIYQLPEIMGDTWSSNNCSMVILSEHILNDYAYKRFCESEPELRTSHWIKDFENSGFLLYSNEENLMLGCCIKKYTLVDDLIYTKLNSQINVLDLLNTLPEIQRDIVVRNIIENNTLMTLNKLFHFPGCYENAKEKIDADFTRIQTVFVIRETETMEKAVMFMEQLGLKEQALILTTQETENHGSRAIICEPQEIYRTLCEQINKSDKDYYLVIEEEYLCSLADTEELQRHVSACYKMLQQYSYIGTVSYANTFSSADSYITEYNKVNELRNLYGNNVVENGYIPFDNLVLLDMNRLKDEVEISETFEEPVSKNETESAEKAETFKDNDTSESVGDAKEKTYIRRMEIEDFRLLSVYCKNKGLLMASLLSRNSWTAKALIANELCEKFIETGMKNGMFNAANMEEFIDRYNNIYSEYFKLKKKQEPIVHEIPLLVDIGVKGAISNWIKKHFHK